MSRFKFVVCIFWIKCSVRFLAEQSSHRESERADYLTYSSVCFFVLHFFLSKSKLNTSICIDLVSKPHSIICMRGSRKFARRGSKSDNFFF